MLSHLRTNMFAKSDRIGQLFVISSPLSSMVGHHSKRVRFQVFSNPSLGSQVERYGLLMQERSSIIPARQDDSDIRGGASATPQANGQHSFWSRIRNFQP